MVLQRIGLIVGSNAKQISAGISARLLSNTSQSSTPPPAASPKPTAASSQQLNAPGLSSKCLQVPDSAVGPGASSQGEYKVPEYFCYDKNSYFEAEIEILKYRLPQPSSKS